MALFLPMEEAHAQSRVDELRGMIESRENQIKQLEDEIEEQERELVRVGQEKQTLQGAVQSLTLTEQKLTNDISLTNNRIYKTTTEIEQLGIEIGEKEALVDKSIRALARSVRTIQQEDGFTIMEKFLSSGSISDLLNNAMQLRQFQRGIDQYVAELRIAKTELGEKQNERAESRDNLKEYRGELSGQKYAIQVTKSEKSDLLDETKGKEAAYQRILREKQEQKEAFERELFAFESQLQFEIDPNSFPTGRPGIFAWPLKSIYVTQMFGETGSSGRLYTSGTHNGTDFRAPIGTSIYATLTGTVIGTGNTDAHGRCLSYGKWVLIEHPNGLTSLYAHLSSIQVERGDSVKTGSVIGHSGNSGYSTGPHLHLSVYASQGVNVQTYTSKTPCNGAKLPLADRDAYLDPLAYLPEISNLKIAPDAY